MTPQQIRNREAELDERLTKNNSPKPAENEPDTIAEGADASIPENEVVDSPEEEAAESTVPESKYKSAVVEMGAIQREAARLRKENAALQTEIESLKNQPKNTPTNQPAENGGDYESVMEQVRDDIPEIAPAFDFLKKIIDQIKADHNGFKDETHWNHVMSAHPDTDEIAGSEDYRNWIDGQPEDTQALMTSNSPIDKIRGLHSYKQSTQPNSPATHSPDIEVAIAPGNEKTAALVAAAEPKIKKSDNLAGGKANPSYESIMRMTPKEYAKEEDLHDRIIFEHNARNK